MLCLVVKGIVYPEIKMLSSFTYLKLDVLKNISLYIFCSLIEEKIRVQLCFHS